MADALLSPAVGGTLWAVTAAGIAHCSRRLRDDPDERRAPLMGVLGAFLFAAQMINFGIPGTGSSGHLAGGLLLAILLGPHAALLVMASVLMVQALFFADGGLLALGCNVFNLGFIPAFVGFPLYRWLCGQAPGRRRAATAAIISAAVSLQLGALGVVLVTVASGITALPFGTFVLFMLPIHLAIGIVEGLLTAAVVSFVRAARPGVLADAASRGGSIRGVVIAFLVLALSLGGVGAWYASEDPDGLEWSVAAITGSSELDPPQSAVHATLRRIQRQVALVPDDGIGKPGKEAARSARGDDTGAGEVRLGTSLAGIAGGLITLAVAVLAGTLLARRAQRAARRS